MFSNFKRLLTISLLVAATCLAFSCKKEIESGTISSRVGIENLTYDPDASDDTSIGAFWDVDKAIKAGATAFNIQLVDISGGNNYSYDKKDGKPFTSVTLLSTDTPNDECVFKNLTKGSQYFLRGRAIYPGSIFSEWLYVTIGTGVNAVIEVGEGPVNVLEAPVQNLKVQPLDKKIRLSWTPKLGVDCYKVSWVAEDEVDWHTAECKDASYVIEDLTPSTGYDVNVVAVRSGEACPDNIVAVRTLVEISDAFIRVKTEHSWGGHFTGITPVGVGLEWSVSNFENIDLDAAQAYTVGVYTDEACKSLVYSFDFHANGSNCSNGSGTVYKLWGPDCAPQDKINEIAHPGFFFSGLKPATDYWFKVDVKDRENISAVIAVRTADDLTVLAGDGHKAEIGQYALYEQFNDLIWGGETSMKLPSFSTTKRSTLTSFDSPKGILLADDKGLVTDGWYICVPNQDIGLFATMGKAIKGSAHITDWRQWTADGNQTRMLARNGFIRAGNSSAKGYIITPELSSLKAPATVEVSVDFLLDGAISTGNVDYQIVSVKDALFHDPTSLGINYQVKEAAFAEITSGEIDRDFNWQTVTLQMQNVYPNARLGFGSLSDKKAINIDNIRIKVISYADVSKQEPVENLSVTNVTDEGAKLTWSAPYGAVTYNIRYKKENDEAWTQVSGVTECEYALTGLEGGVKYLAGVQAVGSGMISEWESIEFETLSSVRKLSFAFAAENLSFTKVEMTSFEKTKLFGDATLLSFDTPIDLSTGKAVADFPVDEFSVTKGLLLTATQADGSKLYRVVFAGENKSVSSSEKISLDPWLKGGISSAADLVEFSRLVNSHPERSKAEFAPNQLARFTDANGFVVLLNDIDRAGWNYEPAGITENLPFVGKFDGNGHTIKNLVQEYNGTVQYTVGLFGVINFKSVVKNVNLDASCSMKYARTSGMARVGSVVCFVQGSPYNADASGGGCSVENVHSAANIEINSLASQQFIVGGVVGQARGGLIDCSYSGTITISGDTATPSSKSQIGGVAGQYAYSYTDKGFEAKNCSFTGTLNYNMTQAVAAIGGVFGDANAANCTGMSFTGVVNVPSANVILGGIFGTLTTYKNKADVDMLSGAKSAGKLVFSASQGADLGLVIGTTGSYKEYRASSITLGGSFGTDSSSLTPVSASTIQSDWSKTWDVDKTAIPLANTKGAADDGALYNAILSNVSYE